MSKTIEVKFVGSNSYNSLFKQYTPIFNNLIDKYISIDVSDISKNRHVESIPKEELNSISARAKEVNLINIRALSDEDLGKAYIGFLCNKDIITTFLMDISSVMKERGIVAFKEVKAE